MPVYNIHQLHAEVQAVERLLVASHGTLEPEVQIALRALLDDVHRLMEALQDVVRDIGDGADDEDNAELAGFYQQSIMQMVDVLRRWRLKLEAPPGSPS